MTGKYAGLKSLCRTELKYIYLHCVNLLAAASAGVTQDSVTGLLCVWLSEPEVSAE